MTRRLAPCLGFSALALLFSISCTTVASGSGPLPVKEELENKGTSAGIPEPFWIKPASDGTLRESGTLPGYTEVIVFVGIADAQNRETAELLAGRQELPAQFIRFIDAQARKALADAKPGILERASFRRLSDRFLILLRESAYSGLRREDDWWSLVRTRGFLGLPNPPVYRAYVLASIGESMLRSQIGAILDRFDENLASDDKKTALPGLIRAAISRSFGL